MGTENRSPGQGRRPKNDCICVSRKMQSKPLPIKVNPLNPSSKEILLRLPCLFLMHSHSSLKGQYLGDLSCTHVTESFPVATTGNLPFLLPSIYCDVFIANRYSQVDFTIASS